MKIILLVSFFVLTVNSLASQSLDTLISKRIEVVNAYIDSTIIEYQTKNKSFYPYTVFVVEFENDMEDSCFSFRVSTILNDYNIIYTYFEYVGYKNDDIILYTIPDCRGSLPQLLKKLNIRPKQPDDTKKVKSKLFNSNDGFISSRSMFYKISVCGKITTKDVGFQMIR